MAIDPRDLQYARSDHTTQAVRRGTRAAQPRAEDVVIGTLYFVTDDTVTERSNGASWEGYGGGVAPPAGQAEAHHLTHEPGGTDPLAVDAAPTVGSLRTLGTGATQAAPGNDARFVTGGGTVTHTGTLTDHGIVVGNGGVDISALATGTNGQFLQSAGAGADPVWVTDTPFVSQRLFQAATLATFNVNSTSYITVLAFCFNVDLDVFPFTHYNLCVAGQANAAATTITAQLTAGSVPATPIHIGGNDLAISNAVSVYRSGYLTRDDGSTGIKEYMVALKGSNATVDLATTYLDVLLKRVF